MHWWYGVERIIVCLSGAIVIAIGAMQMYSSSRASPETIKPMHRLFHPTVVFMGICMGIWGIDPQGVFGIFNFWVLPILKDIIKLSELLCAMYFLYVLLSILNSAASIVRLEWKVCIVPFILGCLILIPTDLIAASLNRQWPRAIGAFYIALLCFLETLVSIKTLVTISKIHHDASEGVYRGKSAKSTHSRSSARCKLIALTVIFLIEGIINTKDGIDEITLNSEVTLEQDQTPQDTSVARVYFSFWLFLLGVIAIVAVAWIPVELGRKDLSHPNKQQQQLTEAGSARVSEHPQIQPQP
jgi:hypothetical protein